MIFSFCLVVYSSSILHKHSSQQEIIWFNLLPRTDAFNPSNMTSSYPPTPPTPPMSMSDLNRNQNCSNEGFSSRACVVAQELVKLNGSEITDFGLGDYDKEVILSALNLLDSGNLTKVLKSISHTDLISIREKLGDETLNSTLWKIPLPERNKIMANLSFFN